MDLVIPLRQVLLSSLIDRLSDFPTAVKNIPGFKPGHSDPTAQVQMLELKKTPVRSTHFTSELWKQVHGAGMS